MTDMPGSNFPPDDEAADENTAKLQPVIIMIQYPEYAQDIRRNFWQLMGRGESVISASRTIVAEMKGRRQEIIAIREGPQQQELDNLGAQRLRVQAETADIERGDARMGRLKTAVLSCVPVVGVAIAGGWIAGLPGAIGGTVAGFLPASLYRWFGNGRNDTRTNP
ncbi:MAG: hypothetical protein LBI34_01610 [Puniceicoccales bacterium]|jgi:hypothetical protein|nr:hypothetical protein [Puniceicoccales bacterium]